MGLGVLIPPELMAYRDVRAPTPMYRCLGRGWGPLQLCPLEAAPMWTDSSYLLDAGGGFHPPPGLGPGQAPSPAMQQFPHLSIKEAGTWCPEPLWTHSW